MHKEPEKMVKRRNQAAVTSSKCFHCFCFTQDDDTDVSRPCSEFVLQRHSSSPYLLPNKHWPCLLTLAYVHVHSLHTDLLSLPLSLLLLLLLRAVVVDAHLHAAHPALETAGLGVVPLEIPALREKVLDDVHVAVERGQVERDLVLVVGHGGAGAPGQQQLDHVQVSAQAGPVEGRVVVCVGEVNVWCLF